MFALLINIHESTIRCRIERIHGTFCVRTTMTVTGEACRRNGETSFGSSRTELMSRDNS